ncbi:MAG: TolC family protein [Muribaculaceae bacterium]|nr:TolC family protein [Muribaculaceae bacterium]
MKQTLLYIALAIAGCGTAAASSGIDELAASIARNNPDYVQAVRDREASVLSMQAADALPAPEIEGEHLWGPAGDNRWGAGISQAFDWPGVYGARAEARREESNAFEQLTATELREHTLAAKQSLIDLVAARRQAALISEIYSNVNELTQWMLNAYDHGQATVLDLRKLQLEKLELENRMEEVEQARAEAIAALQAMGYTRAVPENLDYPADEPDYGSAEGLWRRTPSVSAARAATRAALAREKAAARSALPGFSLGFRHQYEGGSHFNGLTAGITLPAWGSRSSKRAAEAATQAAALRAEAAEAVSDARYRNILGRLQRLDSRRQVYRDVVESSDYPALLKKMLDGGQMTILTYIQELNFYIGAGMAREETERQYQLALAEFNIWN